MLIGEALDTVLNITAFLFIAAMVWLMVRPLAPPRSEDLDNDLSPRP